MDSQLNLLKHITCPRGDACTTVRCLFGHDRDRKNDSSLPSLSQPQTNPSAKTSLPDSAQDRPRKRAKLDTHPLSASASSSAPSLPIQNFDGDRQEGSASLSSDKSSSALPSTPSPQRKANQKATHVRPQATKQATTPAPAVAKPIIVRTPPAVKESSTRKPETLNPRHLGSAPTTHEIRYKLIKLLHGELMRLNKELRDKSTIEHKERYVLSDQELIWMALDMEESCATSKPSIYSNVIKHRIVHYKRMPLLQWEKERTDVYDKEARQKQRAENHQQETAARELLRGNIKPPPPGPIITGLTAQQELDHLKAHLLTPIQDLGNHGYVPSVPTDENIQKARDAEAVSKGWEVCDRCSTRFQVFPGRREEDGALTSGGTCTHHPGRAYYPPRAASALGSDAGRRYRCCGQAVGDSPGCVTTQSHVFKTTDPKRLALLWNFVETPPNPHAPTDRAVCFDCEMGYTTRGMELIRLTATSWPGGEELLDVLVRPLGEVIDLNSRYSGVWPQDISKAIPFSAATVLGGKTKAQDQAKSEDGRKRLPIVSSPQVARDLFFSLISPETPLIGHGLENDLNSMRIVHPTIVDTVLLFPHPKGLPVRYGLKMLMAHHLQRQIQVEPAAGSDALAGHDSAEDARAAGDLVRFKIKQRVLLEETRN